MMAIWQLESEKNDPKFSTTSPSLSSPQNPLYFYLKQTNKNNKQTNKQNSHLTYFGKYV